MKRKPHIGCNFVCLALLGLACVSGAMGATMGQDLGTGAPPPTLGSWTMTPFGADPSALDSLLSSLTTPQGGSLTFSTPVRHDNVANGWVTWSHGYQGDVYDTTAGINTITIGLPSMTHAFYVYAEPNQWASFAITAIAGGTIITTSVQGNGGASGFGFWTDSVAESIVSITLRTDDLDFALGEFGIYRSQTPGVPEAGSTLAYALLGLLGLGGFRSWRAIRTA